MKGLSVILILLTACSSCKQSQHKIVKNDYFIVGEWSLCGIIYYKNNRQISETGFNVCPKITFINNHTGFIKRSAPELLYFNWAIDVQNLKIVHTINNDPDDVIDNGNYKIIQPNNKTYREIDLLDTIKHVKYILGR